MNSSRVTRIQFESGVAELRARLDKVVAALASMVPGTTEEGFGKVASGAVVETRVIPGAAAADLEIPQVFTLAVLWFGLGLLTAVVAIMLAWWRGSVSWNKS